MTEVIFIAPAEVIKVRMQAKERAKVYSNTLDAFFKILRAEGPAAYLQGLETALWRQSAWNGTFFGASFALKEHVLWRPRTKASELGRNFVAGVIGGTLGTVLNNPFDVVVSRMRNVLPGDPPSPYRSAWQSVLLISREEGVGALYKGFGPKVLRLGPGGGILLTVYQLVASMLQ